jgi:hypothetical protein
MTPSPAMAMFHTVTMMDCATSAASPAASADAVWKGRRAPNGDRDGDKCRIRLLNAENQCGSDEQYGAAQQQFPKPAVDQHPDQPDAR